MIDSTLERLPYIVEQISVFIIGLIIPLIILLITLWAEKRKNEKIKKKTLAYELHCNLNYINENIFLIKNGKLASIPLDNIVLISVINSHQIINLKENSIQHLLAFKNKVETINKPVNLNLANDALLPYLRGAKIHLKEILAKELHSKEWWEENELERLNNHTLDSSERI